MPAPAVTGPGRNHHVVDGDVLEVSVLVGRPALRPIEALASRAAATAARLPGSELPFTRRLTWS